MIRGSALEVLKSNSDPDWSDAIRELLTGLDETVSVPTPKEDQYFLMAVEDTFNVTGRGLVVTGQVERGCLRVGDPLELVGLVSDPTATTAAGIESFRKMVEKAVPEDNIGVLCKGLSRADVERGQVLACPGTIAAHRMFSAQIYVLKPEEGGSNTPLLDVAEYVSFSFRTASIPGIFRLPEGIEMALPGDNVSIYAKLASPVAMEAGTRFSVRKGGRTVMIGVVVRIRD